LRGDAHRWPRRYASYLRSIGTLLAGLAPPLLVVRIMLGLAGPGPHEVRMRRTGIRLLARSPMDIWAIKEAALDRLYERYGFPVRPGWVVVDIGAGIGEFSLLAAREGARVMAFEPFPGSCDLLRENVRRNAADVWVQECAIAGASGAVVLDVGPSDSVYYRSMRGDRANGIAVPALSLADALDRWGADRVDLLKLDCEGAEYDILGGAGPDVLARVDRIVLEYHDWDGHTHMELVELLERAGFAVRAAPNRTYPAIGYLWADRPAA
jgi:FkbM family methyltransferase